jgi:hypothetical protein
MAKVAAKQAVVTSIAEVKAKMKETTEQYVPIVKADDPWTQWEAAPVATMNQAVEMVQQALGGTAVEETCAHGARIWKTGTSKAGKPWGMWKCNPPHGTSNYCDPIWYSIAADGSWKPRSE